MAKRNNQEIQLMQLEIERMKLEFQREKQERELEAERAIRERELEAERAIRERELEAERAIRERELEAERATQEREFELARLRMEHERDMARIKQGEDWLNPIEMAKECDNYFSAQGKGFGISYSKKNPQGGGNLPAEEGRENALAYKPRTFGGEFPVRGPRSTQGKCFACNSSDHIKRFCPKIRTNVSNGRMGQPIRNPNAHTRVTQIRVGEDEPLEKMPEAVVIATIQSGGGKIPAGAGVTDKELCELFRVPISVNDKLVEGLVDSGSEITVIRSDMLAGKELGGTGSIYLKGAFGKAIRADLHNLELAIPIDGKFNNVIPRNIVCAVTPEIKEKAIINSQIVNLLKTGGPRYMSDPELEISGEIDQIREEIEAKAVQAISKDPGMASIPQDVNKRGKETMTDKFRKPHKRKKEVKPEHHLHARQNKFRCGRGIQTPETEWRSISDWR